MGDAGGAASLDSAPASSASGCALAGGATLRGDLPLAGEALATFAGFTAGALAAFAGAALAAFAGFACFAAFAGFADFFAGFAVAFAGFAVAFAGFAVAFAGFADFFAGFFALLFAAAVAVLPPADLFAVDFFAPIFFVCFAMHRRYRTCSLRCYRPDLDDRSRAWARGKCSSVSTCPTGFPSRVQYSPHGRQRSPLPPRSRRPSTQHSLRECCAPQQSWGLRSHRGEHGPAILVGRRAPCSR